MEFEARGSPNWTADPTDLSFVPFKNPFAALVLSAGMAKGTERESDAAKAVLSYLEFDLTAEKINQLYSKCDWGDKWPLVSAARYGLRDICDFIVATLTSQKYFHGAYEEKESTSYRMSVYEMVLASLQVAVSQNHTTTAQYFITVLKSVEFGARFDWLVRTYGKSLFIAVRNQNDELVQALADSTPLSSFAISNRNVLHLAAQLGRADYVTYLMEAMQSQRVHLDIPDESRGWTPLFYAAYHGHFDVAERLLAAGFQQGTDL